MKEINSIKLFCEILVEHGKEKLFYIVNHPDPDPPCLRRILRIWMKRELFAFHLLSQITWRVLMNFFTCIENGKDWDTKVSIIFFLYSKNDSSAIYHCHTQGTFTCIGNGKDWDTKVLIIFLFPKIDSTATYHCHSQGTTCIGNRKDSDTKVLINLLFLKIDSTAIYRCWPYPRDQLREDLSKIYRSSPPPSPMTSL